MNNNFFSFLISISLILIVVSPIIVNAVNFDTVELSLENNEEEKENKKDISQEFDADQYIVTAFTPNFLALSNSTQLFASQKNYSLILDKLYSPPPEFIFFS